jgi:chaperonin GroES|tara:strand:- start:860 stop:1132 length:273 start_codon:yes stop_codon:yes gene_type:complete
MATIRPIGDRILIKQHKPQETYGSTGIYIPESSQEKDDRGTVVAIGDEVKGIYEGEVVLFNQFIQPVKVHHMDEEHILLKQQDIWAIQDV